MNTKNINEEELSLEELQNQENSLREKLNPIQEKLNKLTHHLAQKKREEEIKKKREEADYRQYIERKGLVNEPRGLAKNILNMDFDNLDPEMVKNIFLLTIGMLIRNNQIDVRVLGWYLSAIDEVEKYEKEHPEILDQK